MSYENDECKLLIDEALHDYLHDDTANEMVVKDWFYDLREQAAKADEYKAKAKAFDELKSMLVEGCNKFNPSNEKYDTPQYFINMGAETAYKDILNKVNKYESGESDD